MEYSLKLTKAINTKTSNLCSNSNLFSDISNIGIVNDVYVATNENISEDFWKTNILYNESKGYICLELNELDYDAKSEGIYIY